MPGEPAKAGAGSRKEVNLNVLAAQFDKELLRQRQFGAVWGELVEGGCPKTLDEAIALKKAQMADLKERTGVQSAQAAVYTTQMQRDFPPRTGASQLGDLVRAGPAWRAARATTHSRPPARHPQETGLGKAYKVLRAGI